LTASLNEGVAANRGALFYAASASAISLRLLSMP
jgi:hypothetical protein